MRLVLDVATEQQKQDIIELAERLQVTVEVEPSEEEEDAAMLRAIDAGAKNDILSEQEVAAFLLKLAK
ncbi:hypothetical protein [uncultured Mucilaginibacter sp.]|uniref:hypothetical protein n=1 Tax=uncultured Mucilaginibacter sp. TaxID=797541 RepID=UPI002602A8DA|nr:hypothetical protein [uncultured Mucilaginibacter sp.]